MARTGGGDVDPERDIERLHVVLADWLVGIRDDPRPFADSLDDGFVAIVADGAVHDANGYLAHLETLRETAPPQRIELDDVEHRRAIYGIHLVTFVKRYQRPDGDRNLATSIWLRETDRTNTGLQLLHLHETPIVPDEER